MTSYDLSRAVWRKSARTHANGECVEVALVWCKSSYSHVNGDCVEVVDVRHAVAVRDSKDPEGPKLFVSAHGWADLLGAVKSGSHDLS
jgi:hypothetical protein